MKVAEISVVLVSWRDAEEVVGAVASLAAARDRIRTGGPSVSLVVVENGGSLPREAILSLWPGATLLVNPSNRGLAAAANQGAAAAAGDALLFLNPDTRAEGDAFTAIARGFASAESVVAVAPRLLDAEEAAAPAPVRRRPLTPPGREDQFTFQLRRLPSLAADARELLLLDHLRPDNGGRRRFRYADRDPDRPLAVEQAAGAALAVRREVFERLGGYDERFFPAYFEDVDLCARLLAEGTILYWPDARFRHGGGAASERLGYARFLPLFYRNALRYRRRHYALAARLLYRPILVAGMLLRLALLPVRPAVPRPRSEMARAYLSTLGAALRFGREP